MSEETKTERDIEKELRAYIAANYKAVDREQRFRDMRCWWCAGSHLRKRKHKHEIAERPAAGRSVW